MKPENKHAVDNLMKEYDELTLLIQNLESLKDGFDLTPAYSASKALKSDSNQGAFADLFAEFREKLLSRASEMRGEVRTKLEPL